MILHSIVDCYCCSVYFEIYCITFIRTQMSAHQSQISDLNPSQYFPEIYFVHGPIACFSLQSLVISQINSPSLIMNTPMCINLDVCKISCSLHQFYTHSAKQNEERNNQDLYFFSIYSMLKANHQLRIRNRSQRF